MTEYPKTLDEAMARFQAQLPSIAKDEKATVKSDKGQYSYGYAGLDTVSEKVLRLLGSLGVSWRTRPTLTEDGRFVLAYRLRHISGEEETGTWPLAGSTPQQIGSSITYARRYALMAVTGVFPSNEDDDGAAASSAPARQNWDDEWQAMQPATPQQKTVFEQFLRDIKAAADQERITTIGTLVKEARGGGRISQYHYDRLSRAASDRLAKLHEEVPA